MTEIQPKPKEIKNMSDSFSEKLKKRFIFFIRPLLDLEFPFIQGVEVKFTVNM